MLSPSNLSPLGYESDGKMLWEKLEKAELGEKGTLIVDAIDDEPYISSQMARGIHHHDKFAVAIWLCEKVLSPEKTYIAMYKHIFDTNFSIPKKIGGY